MNFTHFHRSKSAKSIQCQVPILYKRAIYISPTLVNPFPRLPESNRRLERSRNSECRRGEEEEEREWKSLSLFSPSSSPPLALAIAFLGTGGGGYLIAAEWEGGISAVAFALANGKSRFSAAPPPSFPPVRPSIPLLSAATLSSSSSSSSSSLSGINFCL